jgi:mRNA interferase RelE/StbE
VYQVVFTKQAAKSLQKMPRNMATLIREKLSQIAEDPFAQRSNITKLQIDQDIDSGLAIGE